MPINTSCLLDQVGRPLRYASTTETLDTKDQFVASKSIVFGTGKVCNLGDAIHFERTTPISVSIFFKTTSSAWKAFLFSYPNVATQYRGWMFSCDTKLYFSMNSDYTAGNICGVLGSTTTINDGSWHHAVLTYTGSSNAAGITIYYDNVAETLTASTDNLTGTVVTTAPGTIGASGDAAISAPFIGSLCHLSVWNRPLTAAEVGVLYNGKKPQELRKLPFFNACTNWWKLGDGDTWPVAKDSVGTIPGMLTGMSAASIATDAP